MKNFLEKYNATKIENSKDEGMLTLEKAKERKTSRLYRNRTSKGAKNGQSF